MSYGNCLCPVGHLLSCADVVDCMKNVNIDDAQIVLGHLFGRMGGHVVLSKPDHFPDTFDP